VPTYTLAQLRAQQLQAAISARLTTALSAAGLPIASWAPAAFGGIELSVVEMVAGTLASIVAPKLVAIAEGRFLDLATGDWLTALAKSRYKLDRNVASYTIQSMTLTSTVGDNFAPLDLWVSGAGGNRYVNLDPIALKPGIPASFKFQAENPGSSYTDAANTVTKMVTAPAGLTGFNAPAAAFVDTKLSGVSSGKIIPSFVTPGVPPPFNSIRVRIDASGNIGAGLYALSTDGGVTWPTGGVISGAVGVGAGSLGQAKLVFVDGTTPSFVAGDIFTMIVADALTQRGADAESDASLRARCRSRWGTLSDVPTEGLVRLWCQIASPEIVRVRVDADANSPGGFLCTIASATGPASPLATLAVQDYIGTRLRGFQGIPGPPLSLGNSPAEHVQCNSASARQITQSGLVTVAKTKLSAVQVEADRLWALYLGSVPIGGLVRQTELVQAIMDAGASDVTDILIGLPMLPHNNVQLAFNEVAVAATGVTLASSMTWKPI
jgi:hypothetical protein